VHHPTLVPSQAVIAWAIIHHLVEVERALRLGSLDLTSLLEAENIGAQFKRSLWTNFVDFLLGVHAVGRHHPNSRVVG
jgi:hypothetical protein